LQIKDKLVCGRVNDDAAIIKKNFAESVRKTTVSALEHAPLCRDSAGNLEEQTSLKYVRSVTIHVQKD
jgi:hypothetical protein